MSLYTRLKSVFGLGGTAPFFWGWASPLGEWGQERQLQQYKRYVYSIVSAIAQDVAMANLVIKNGRGVEQENHPLMDVLRRPNPMSSQFQFLELHQTYMELCGESFWYLTFPNQVINKPDHIYLLRPDMVDVVVAADEVGSVKGYTLRKPNGERLPLNTTEVIHHKMPNPLNPYRGLGVIEAAHWFIQTEEFASDWLRNSIYNSGRPSGIVSIKGTIGEDEFKQLKSRFRAEYAGTANAGKTMFIRSSQGIEYQKLGMELISAAVKELKDVTKEDLMMMFRVSKTMLGMSTDVNLANAREARAVWLQNIIQPKIWRLVDQLDSDLVQRYGDYRLDFTSSIPADHQEARDDFKAGVITLNEARAAIGEAELPDGDLRYMPVNMMPQDGSTQDASQEEKTFKQEISSEQKEAFRKDIFVRQTAWERKYQNVVNQVFDSQKEQILQRGVNKAFEEWKFDPALSKQKFVNLLFPVTAELMKEQAEAALQFAGDPDTEFTLSERVEKFINERIELFATDTDRETLEKIQESISEGVTAGDSLDKLRKRILVIYTEATTVRSQRIARTETIAASNEAALEAYKQSPLVKQKEWLAEPNACEFCDALNGKVIGLDTDFAKTGETIAGTEGGTQQVNYTDISAPPGHPNCRCTILPVASVNLSLVDSSTVNQQIKTMEKQYEDMDKRTREAKELMRDIQWERARLEADKKELQKDKEALDEAIDELDSRIDE